MIIFPECNAGFYGGNATECSPCLGNTVKSFPGDADTCDTVCHPEKSSPNPDHTDCGTVG